MVWLESRLTVWRECRQLAQRPDRRGRTLHPRCVTRSFDLVVTDVRLGGRRDGGLQVIAAAGMLCPEASIVALTAYPDDENRLASLRLGATHFFEKPVALETIAEVAATAGVPTAMTPVLHVVRTG